MTSIDERAAGRGARLGARAWLFVRAVLWPMLARLWAQGWAWPQPEGQEKPRGFKGLSQDLWAFVLGVWRGFSWRALFGQEALWARLRRPDLVLLHGAELARGQLVLWLPVFFGAGAALWLALPFEPPRESYRVFAGFAALFALLWLWRGRRNGALGLVAAALCMGLLAFTLLGLRAHQLAAPVLGFRYYGPIEGRIVAVDRSGSDKIRLTLDQIRLDRVEAPLLPLKIRLSLAEEPGVGGQAHFAPAPGMRVMTTGQLLPPNGPSQPQGFDFRQKFWFEQVGALGYTRVPVLRAPEGKRTEPELAERVSLAAHGVRMQLSQAMQARIGGQGGAIAAALMVGDRSGILAETNDIMRSSNLYHIISISGLHMGMLAGFIFALIRAGLALLPWVSLRLNTKKIAAFVAVLACTLYMWLAGPNVATERSYLMALVMLFAVLVDRRALTLNTIALAALVVLLRHPEAVAEAGFQMSFAATVALVLLARPWEGLALRLPPFARPVVLLVLSSMVAGLVTGPIAAAQFNRMAEYGVVANLLVVPVMGGVVMPAGVLAGIFAPLGLAGPFLWLMGLGCEWMILVARAVTWAGGTAQAVPSPQVWVLPLLLFAAILLCLGRGLGRGLALGLVLLGLGAWAQVERPLLLISGEAELVGLMTPAGRALSKSSSDFIARAWLDGDGDVAERAVAAARAGFSGPRGARRAAFLGRDLWHLTGKGALARLAEICAAPRAPRPIVVVAERVEAEYPACEIYDLTRLKASGALAFDAQGRVTSVAQSAGARIWVR